MRCPILSKHSKKQCRTLDTHPNSRHFPVQVQTAFPLHSFTSHPVQTHSDIILDMFPDTHLFLSITLMPCHPIRFEHIQKPFYTPDTSDTCPDTHPVLPMIFHYGLSHPILSKHPLRHQVLLEMSGHQSYSVKCHPIMFFHIPCCPILFKHIQTPF